MDLLLGVRRPGCVVQLRDVVDDVLDAANDDFATLGIRLVHHAVQRTKNIIFEHLPIRLAYGSLLPLLFIQSTKVFFIVHREWFLAIAHTQTTACV